MGNGELHQARKAIQNGPGIHVSPLDKERSVHQALLARGTGGTDVVPLLKFLRKENEMALIP